MKTLQKCIKLDKENFNLTAEFNNALKDEKFKILVDKLKTPYDKLIKYTTILQDCSEEYNNCLNCKNIMECKNKIRGYAYLPEIEDKKIKFGYKMCSKQKKIEKQNKYLENVYCYNIPKAIKEAKMKDIITQDKNRVQIIKWLNSFIKNYTENKETKGLYLYGSFGSGKTYLISALFNELAKQQIKSAIIFWPEYLVELKSSFNHDDYQDKINKLKKVPLLLLDDIGAETTTSWSRDEVLCPIVQYRMQEKLPTFFTSNLDIESLEQNLSITKQGVDEIKARRIIERINQLTDKMELVSKNYRK